MDSVNIGRYEIPLIPSGLRHEETIVQTANVLEYLNNTINDVFEKIDNRVNANNAKLAEIQKRIDLANEKIRSLVGTKKPICIYSPSKFPGDKILKDIPLTFNKESFKSIKFNLEADYEIVSDLEPLTQTSLQDKLEFFHVREPLEPTRLQNILNTQQVIGPIPKALRSVNSLLLYNTTQNVYANKKDKGVFFSKTQMQSNVEKVECTKKIEAPPISITNRNIGTERKSHQKLFYTPKLINAPYINLPLDLPDLPGIAEIHFEIDNENSDFNPLNQNKRTQDYENKNKKIEKIQNNIHFNDNKNNNNNNNSNNNKNYNNNNGSDNKNSNNNTNNKSNNNNKNNNNNNINISIKKNNDNNTNINKEHENSLETDRDMLKQYEEQNENLSSIPANLFAPPPPPPPLPQNNENEVKGNKGPPLTNISEHVEARSSLMEAIRKAGGIRGGKLRAAADVVNEENTRNKNSKQKSNNLMDDLHKKLLMRRKGISGVKDSEKSGNVLDRLSSLIPPPPKPNQTAYSSTSDNENDDWD